MCIRDSRRLVRVYGRNVELPSVVSLDLPEANSEAPELRVILGRGRGEAIVHNTGMSMWFEDAELTIDVPEAYGPLASEHLILDHGVPIALAMMGDVILHSAGLEKNGAGIVLLGDSGRGKSVTSQYLGSRGWRILSDDAVRIEIDDESITMWPGYDGVRLHEHSFGVLGADLDQRERVAEYGTKRRLSGQQDFTIDSAPLRTAFALGPEDSELTAEPLSPSRLLAMLTASAFNPPANPSAAIDRLDTMTPFAERLNGYELRFERTEGILRGLEEVLASLTS